jgi:hypothetical protein
MVGSTRSRIGFFLNKSRKLGFIGYNGELHLTGGSHMHSSLLKICLHDWQDTGKDCQSSHACGPSTFSRITIVFPQPAVTAAGPGSQVILAERRFMVSEEDIDVRRCVGVNFKSK